MDLLFNIEGFGEIGGAALLMVLLGVIGNYIPSKFKALASLGLGIVISMAYFFAYQELAFTGKVLMQAVVSGVMLGAIASGLYSVGGKAVINKISLKKKTTLSIVVLMLIMPAFIFGCGPKQFDTALSVGKVQKSAVEKMHDAVALAAIKGLITEKQEAKYIELSKKITQAQRLYGKTLIAFKHGTASRGEIWLHWAEYMTLIIDAVDTAKELGLKIPGDLAKTVEQYKLAEEGITKL